MAVSFNPSSLFIKTYVTEPNGQRKICHEINPSNLSKDECHLFVISGSFENEVFCGLVTTIFSRSNPQLSNKLQATVEDYEGFKFKWIRFPIEYKDVAIRIAKTFHKKVTTFSQMVRIRKPGLDEPIDLAFPQGSNVLFFQEECVDPTRKVYMFNYQKAELSRTVQELEDYWDWVSSVVNLGID